MSDWERLVEQLRIARADVALIDAGEDCSEEEEKLLMDAQFMAEVALLNGAPPDFGAIATKLHVLADSGWISDDSHEGEMLRRIAQEASRLAERGSAVGTIPEPALSRSCAATASIPSDDRQEGIFATKFRQMRGRVARYLKPGF